jgi:membrane protein YdbS with pleckstrin-like domain
VSLREAGAPSRRKTFLFTGFAAGLASGVWLLSAGSTIAAGGTLPDDVGAWPLLLMFLLGYGLIPFLIAHRWVDDAASHPRVVVAIAPTVTGAWMRTVTVPLFLWLGLALCAVGGVLLAVAIVGSGGASELFSGVIMLVVTLPVLALARLRISVDWRGLKVTSWILGMSLKTIPLNRVESVQTARIEPLKWGGWGYRIRPGRSAIILRTGPGLVVTLTNGKQFALTLDAPETAAALLTTLSAGSD